MGAINSYFVIVYCGGILGMKSKVKKQYAQLKQLLIEYIKVPDIVKNEFLEYSNEVNRSTTIILCIAMLIIEMSNMIRVLFFTTSKLSTTNNQIYFTMYLTLYISSIIILILLQRFKNKPIALARLYTSMALFWMCWHVVFNSYELQRSSDNGVYVFITAIFGIAIFLSLKPISLLIIYGITNILFLLLTYSVTNSGVLINLSITISVALFASFTRFRHVTIELTQQKEINEFNQQLSLEQEKLRISLDKHEIIMRQSNDVMFEWDLNADCLIFSKTWQVKYNMPMLIEHAESWIQEGLKIYEIQEIQEILLKCKTGLPYAEFDFRVEMENQDFHWYRVRISMQYDGNYLPFKGIGILMDIDKQKRELTQLTSLLKIDPLTSVLNKKAFGEYAKESLLTLPPHHIMAMLIIDLDGFKGINDMFGHPYGDHVLVEIANCLKKTFCEHDILGRIGGDEFSVIIPRAKDRDEIIEKAKELLNTIHDVIWKKDDLTVNCSIGISIAQSNKVTFEQIYQEADAALYQVKRSGKGMYTIYE